jgi:hypothetical protein
VSLLLDTDVASAILRGRSPDQQMRGEVDVQGVGEAFEDGQCGDVGIPRHVGMTGEPRGTGGVDRAWPWCGPSHVEGRTKPDPRRPAGTYSFSPLSLTQWSRRRPGPARLPSRSARRNPRVDGEGLAQDPGEPSAAAFRRPNSCAMRRS